MLGQYLYTRSRVQSRLKRALEGVKQGNVDIYEGHRMATFSSPPVDYRHPIWGSAPLPVSGSFNN